jgi:transposase
VLTLPSSVRIFVAAEPVDLRRGFDGLAAATRSVIREEPESGHLFVFLNRRRNRIKLLVWDRTGYLIVYKRLEAGTFTLTSSPAPGHRHIEMDAGDLALLLEGIDLWGRPAGRGGVACPAPLVTRRPSDNITTSETTRLTSAVTYCSITVI